MLRISYADSFMPDPGPTSSGLILTASNGGTAGLGGSGVIPAPAVPEPAIRSLREAERSLPVLGEVDVLVCGGGAGGVGAAVGAARAGANTLLIERYGFLGGMGTGGLVVPHFDGFLNDGINKEIIAALKARAGWGAPHWKISYDPEILKSVSEEIVLASGCDLLYHSLAVATVMEGDAVRGAVIETKSGRFALLAKVVVDATGDGDVAARAGAEVVRGRESDGIMQPLTLMFRMGGVKWVQRNGTELFELAQRAAQASGDTFRLAFERPWALHVPNPDEVIFQLVHVRGVDATDVRELTRAEIDGRRQAYAVAKFLRARTEEFKDAYLIETACQIGVRETRHIIGDYVLNQDDLLAGRAFPDGIANVSFGIDIHRPDDQGQTGISLKAPYQIPYRCLVPRGIDNLLVAGRPISGTHEAHASYRVKGPCLAIGQAAGAAAAVAIKQRVAPRQVDMPALLSELQRQGARVQKSERLPEVSWSHEGDRTGRQMTVDSRTD